MNEFFGTLAYMAPEILTKQPYTRNVDIWSLGVTVFELVTGKHPFIAFSKSDLKFKHSLGKYKVSNNLKLSY